MTWANILTLRNTEQLLRARHHSYLQCLLLYLLIYLFVCAGSQLQHMGFFFFFFSNFIYLAQALLGLHCCEGFSLVLVSRGYSLVAAHRLPIVVASLVAQHRHGLQVHGLRVTAPWLQSTSSVVVAHGISCSVASGIFLDQVSNLCLLHWQADSLPLSHQVSPAHRILIGVCRIQILDWGLNLGPLHQKLKVLATRPSGTSCIKSFNF